MPASAPAPQAQPTDLDALSTHWRTILEPPAGDQNQRKLEVLPQQTAVFETDVMGIAAGCAGGFEVVVGVDRGGDADELRRNGADCVVGDLFELLDPRLAA